MPPPPGRLVNRAFGPELRSATIAVVRWLESLAAEARSLDAYLREIARFPELTGAQERQLAERVRRRDSEAVAQLAASQLGLVLRYAQKYRHLGVSLGDLVHDGNLALVDAARRFHPERDGRFASYALWWVRQGILAPFVTSDIRGARPGCRRPGRVSQSGVAGDYRARVQRRPGRRVPHGRDSPGGTPASARDLASGYGRRSAGRGLTGPRRHRIAS